MGVAKASSVCSHARPLPGAASSVSPNDKTTNMAQMRKSKFAEVTNEPYALVVTEKGSLCTIATEKLIGDKLALGSIYEVRRGNKSLKVTPAAFGTKLEMEEFEQWYMNEETSSDSDEGTCSLFDSGEWRDLLQAEFSNVVEQKNKEKSTDKMSGEKMKMRDVDVVYETVDEATNVQGYEQQASGEDSENVSPNIGDPRRRTEDAGESYSEEFSMSRTTNNPPISSSLESGPDFDATIDALAVSMSKLELPELHHPFPLPVDSKPKAVPFHPSHPISPPTIISCVPPHKVSRVDSYQRLTNPSSFRLHHPPYVHPPSYIPPAETQVHSKQVRPNPIHLSHPPLHGASRIPSTKHNASEPIPFRLYNQPGSANRIPHPACRHVVHPLSFPPNQTICTVSPRSSGNFTKLQHSSLRLEPQLISTINQPIASSRTFTQLGPPPLPHTELHDKKMQRLMVEINQLNQVNEKISKQLKDTDTPADADSKPLDQEQTGEQQTAQGIHEVHQPMPREERLAISAQLAVTRKLAMHMKDIVRPDPIQRTPAVIIPYAFLPLPPPLYVVSSDCPEPYKIRGVTTENCLKSDNIIRGELLPVEEVLTKYAKLIRIREPRPIHICTLCVKLAKEAIFGEQIMMACNVTGKGNIYPGLPYPELCLLKKILLEQYPRYWDNLDRFEFIWKRCVKALRYACRKERIEMSKHLTEDAIQGVFGGHL